MTPGILFFAALCIASGFFLLGRQRALYSPLRDVSATASRPYFYGWWTSFTAVAPVLALLVLWSIFGSTILEYLVEINLPAYSVPEGAIERQQFFAQVKNALDGRLVVEPTERLRAAAALYKQFRTLLYSSLGSIGIALCLAGGLLALRLTKQGFKAQARVEHVLNLALLLSSIIAVLTTFAIAASLLFESLRFFNTVPFSSLFGVNWSPLEADISSPDQANGEYGVVGLVVGTLLISLIAMVVAVPVGLMSAVYFTQYADRRFRSFSKPMLEVLAGIPTVVYGFFALLLVSPLIKSLGAIIGLNVASQSALGVGIVMGIMIIPYMSSLCDDALMAVPKAMRDASLALGATNAETITKVLLPAALPGIMGAVLLCISRAIGETMIVVMAAGLAANLTFNPLDSVTTVTVQIVQLLTGDQQFESAKTLSAFALGLILFFMTLAMNAAALLLVRRYRKRYD